MNKERTLDLLREMYEECVVCTHKEALRTAIDELTAADRWTNSLAHIADRCEGMEAAVVWIWDTVRGAVVHGWIQPADFVKQACQGRSQKDIEMLTNATADFLELYAAGFRAEAAKAHRAQADAPADI